MFGAVNHLYTKLYSQNNINLDPLRTAVHNEVFKERAQALTAIIDKLSAELGLSSVKDLTVSFCNDSRVTKIQWNNKRNLILFPLAWFETFPELLPEEVLHDLEKPLSNEAIKQILKNQLIIQDQDTLHLLDNMYRNPETALAIVQFLIAKKLIKIEKKMRDSNKELIRATKSFIASSSLSAAVYYATFSLEVVLITLAVSFVVINYWQRTREAKAQEKASDLVIRTFPQTNRAPTMIEAYRCPFTSIDLKKEKEALNVESGDTLTQAIVEEYRALESNDTLTQAIKEDYRNDDTVPANSKGVALTPTLDQDNEDDWVKVS